MALREALIPSSCEMLRGVLTGGWRGGVQGVVYPLLLGSCSVNFTDGR